MKIPLSDKFTVETPIPDCQFNYKVGGTKMNMGIADAKYLGIETIETPAGMFECLENILSIQSKSIVCVGQGKYHRVVC